MSTVDFSYFTDEQWSVIVGSLLGDGSIDKPMYGNSSFNKPQCAAHFEYLKWHEKLFEGKCTDVKTGLNWAEGKSYIRHSLRLSSHPVFTELRKKWYPNDKKIVPLDLKLDPLSVAIWFFDDGSNVLEDRSASFATYCFAKQEVEFLCRQLLERFSIKSRVSKKGVIRVDAESYKTLVDLVKPYMIWPCFNHKIAYRDSELKFTTDEEARRMIEMQESGMILKDIAAKQGCSISVVSAIIRGERKKHLGQQTRVTALNNKSGHKGICFDKERQKWIATARVDGKNKRLGRFSTLEDALKKQKKYLENDLENAISMSLGL